jgi:glycerate kinase
VPPGGGALGNIARIHRPTRNVVAGVSVLGLFDARFPLLGPNGAARRFAPQKGADPACVEVLEAGIANLALHFRTDLAVDVFSVPGGSAAGGIGAGLVAFLSATLAPGADYIMELAEFDRHLVGCDVVVTGEGRVDEQTPDGKVVGAVIQRAHAAGKPVILFAGRAEPGWEVMRRTGEVELRVTSAGGSVPRREEAAQILQFAAASAFDERGT